MIRNWPLLFIIIPLIEIYLLIKVGSQIGAGWTVGLVLLTAFIGVNLLRYQGISTLTRARQNMQMGQIPAMEMMEGLALAVGGALLITPGFLTDAIGFLCLIPASRRAIIRRIMASSRVHVSGFGPGGFGAGQTGQDRGYTHQSGGQSPDSSRKGTTIEGEYIRKDE